MEEFFVGSRLIAEHWVCSLARLADVFTFKILAGLYVSWTGSRFLRLHIEETIPILADECSTRRWTVLSRSVSLSNTDHRCSFLFISIVKEERTNTYYLFFLHHQPLALHVCISTATSKLDVSLDHRDTERERGREGKRRRVFGMSLFLSVCIYL